MHGAAGEPERRVIERRADVIGIFPSDRAVIHLVGALLPEGSNEWAISRR